MAAALVLLLVGLGAMAAGVLIGRYYVPDDRQLRRTARHSKAYMRALSHLIARDHDTVVSELRGVVEENVEDVEPYFALGAMFRSLGEHERAIRVHQALALRERDKRKLRQRAMYELGLDFRAAGMPRRATRAMEEVLRQESGHEGALRALAALYEEQARFNEAAQLWQRLGKRRNEDTTLREHHLLVAAAQAALGRDDLDSAKTLLKGAGKHDETAHFFTAAAELAAVRGNHRGARERLKQALVADPGLAPHLLPGLIAAEEGILADEKPGPRDSRPTLDELDDSTSNDVPPDNQAKLLAGSEPNALATTSGSVIGPEPDRSISVRSEAKLVGVPLVPSTRPNDRITTRVLALLAEIEAETGPRLELALIRAQLVPADEGARLEAASDLVTRFPKALAARVATARLALAGGDAATIRTALDALVAEQGLLAWALRGRWQCASCGNRPGSFSWRCGQCRRWSSLRMETGVEPPPTPSRERRAAPRSRPEGLLGAAPDESLPAATLDPGLSDDELATAGTRRSLLGRVGGWVSGAWRRDRPQ
ncbi:MAG: N-acetylglucosaminyl transferase-like protein [Deltaproteobacteria bacterium]|nr:N-acetylglucosaminyl transferase-like protein [Deltaproteobacteria bacterium]